ncbi:AbiJ-NTD4 domain-containing protein [Stenotrophomonas nematodicola]|uniref:AbiJ-NTD4 domain-containing protein n=1 Tax=Stenotrophomonas nematodicola TaxID=2656746 RepID=A0ABW7CZ36_9GAMM
MKPFSERFGYTAPDPDITIREDAPDVLRGSVTVAAGKAGLNFNDIRRIVCETLSEPVDLNSWSESNVTADTNRLLENCHWFEVYEVIEHLAEALQQRPGRFGDQSPLEVFAASINKVFRKAGIGWQLIGVEIQMRGSEVFEQAVREGRDRLWSAGKQTTAKQLHEALQDLSRRPNPDVTGAIQHALAALECISRDCALTEDTLGDVVKRNRDLFPSPLGDVVAKMWGYSSNTGRHLLEGKEPTFEEAELMVGLSGVLCRYLARKHGALRP